MREAPFGRGIEKFMGKKSKTQVGRTVQTRDEFFEGQEGYRKLGYESKGNYRKAVVVAQSGKKRALVKLTKGSPKGKPLTNEKVSKYRPYVETKDDEGNAIAYGKKFRPNQRKKDLTMHDVTQIAIDCFQGNSKRVKENRNKVREMKGRPKK